MRTLGDLERAAVNLHDRFPPETPLWVEIGETVMPCRIIYNRPMPGGGEVLVISSDVEEQEAADAGPSH
jgi:hypothetical protein